MLFFSLILQLKDAELYSYVLKIINARYFFVYVINIKLDYYEKRTFCCKLFTFGLLLLSCTNEYDELTSEKESKKDLKELSAGYSCNGSGQCLPVVTVMHLNKYSSTSGTMVTWAYGYPPH